MGLEVGIVCAAESPSDSETVYHLGEEVLRRDDGGNF